MALNKIFSPQWKTPLTVRNIIYFFMDFFIGYLLLGILFALVFTINTSSVEKFSTNLNEIITLPLQFVCTSCDGVLKLIFIVFILSMAFCIKKAFAIDLWSARLRFLILMVTFIFIIFKNSEYKKNYKSSPKNTSESIYSLVFYFLQLKLQ